MTRGSTAGFSSPSSPRKSTAVRSARRDRPTIENIRYYPTAAAAEAAGFRPCLRCRPEASPGTPAWFGTSSVVSRALRLIGDGALDRESVDRFADRLGVTSRHLRRLFVQHLGATPIDVALTRRVQSAKKLLDETQLPFAQVAIAAGFGSLRRFNGEMRRTYARTPTQLAPPASRRSGRRSRSRTATGFDSATARRMTGSRSSRSCRRAPRRASNSWIDPGIAAPSPSTARPDRLPSRRWRERRSCHLEVRFPDRESAAVDRRAREADVRRRRRSGRDCGAARRSIRC